MSTTHHLNAKNLLCPMPVIRLQSQVKSCKPGDTVIVQATDPGTLYDIPAWCRIHGHAVTETFQSDDLITMTIAVQE